jgi:hypothetical protein
MAANTDPTEPMTNSASVVVTADTGTRRDHHAGRDQIRMMINQRRHRRGRARGAPSRRNRRRGARPSGSPRLTEYRPTPSSGAGVGKPDSEVASRQAPEQPCDREIAASQHDDHANSALGAGAHASRASRRSQRARRLAVRGWG